MDVQAYLAEQSARVDRALDGLLPPPTTPPTQLHGAMRHLVFPGGKRLRPALAMAASEAVGSTPEAALPVATAVELIHTYSLIHDDLPCMDDDTERRGRPTVHVVYGEAVAVLAGDALLALAFEAVAGETDSERARLAARELARAAGSAGMVGGQADDLGFAAAEASASQVEEVHARKSAALIAAALVGGARLGGADEVQLATLARFGRAVGVAFQIVDDLLDASQDDQCSVVRFLGGDAARRRAEELLEGALTQLEDWGQRAEPVRELARYAARRDR